MVLSDFTYKVKLEIQFSAKIMIPVDTDIVPCHQGTLLNLPLPVIEYHGTGLGRLLPLFLPDK